MTRINIPVKVKKCCVLKIDIEYPNELHKLHHDYALAKDKIETKKEMLFNNKLKIAKFCNIPI